MRRPRHAKRAPELRPSTPLTRARVKRVRARTLKVIAEGAGIPTSVTDDMRAYVPSE